MSLRSRSELLSILRSPVTGATLRWDERTDQLRALEGEETFPVIAGIPILIDENRSAFRTDAFLSPAPRAPWLYRQLRSVARATVPSLSHNLASAGNYRKLLAELARDGKPVHDVLVIGGAIVGEGFEVLVQAPSVRLVETDVAYGPRTDVICDGHALPFAGESFDAVVCQAVLEHVADPPQVVSEIHRVLKPDGLVYSEIPFMQQVHEGLHDFTRYTLIGHRRLYRHFECLISGPTAGPATALAWSVKYLMLTVAGRSSVRRNLVTVAVNYLLFWLKYLDHFLVHFPGAADAAFGTYLLGRRSDRVTSDRELLDVAGADGTGFLIHRG